MKISFECPIYTDKKSGIRYVKSKELTKTDLVNLAKRIKLQEKEKLATKLSKLKL